MFEEFNSHKLSKHNIGYLNCGLCKFKVDVAKNLCKHYRDTHFPGINILVDDQVNRTTIDSAQQRNSVNMVSVVFLKITFKLFFNF